jgi:hypothetical protein
MFVNELAWAHGKDFEAKLARNAYERYYWRETHMNDV